MSYVPKFSRNIVLWSLANQMFDTKETEKLQVAILGNVRFLRKEQYSLGFRSTNVAFLLKNAS